MKQLTPWTVRIRMFFRFVLTIIMFYSFYYILSLLFHPTLELDEKFRDLLNIVIGSFLVSFGKIVDFWFKKDDEGQSLEPQPANIKQENNKIYEEETKSLDEKMKDNLWE
mgnify:CR=1 FL=1